MTTETSPPEPKQKRYHWLVILLAKVLIWSLIVYVAKEGLDRIGWPGWEKFSHRATVFTKQIAKESFALSPLALWMDIRSDRIMLVKDPDRKFVPEHTVRKPNPFSFPKNDSIDEVVTAFQPMVNRRVTFLEKIGQWCRGFWVYPDGAANWVGRILLALVLLLAAFLPSMGKSDTAPWPIRIIQFLFFLPFVLLAFYGIFYVFEQVLGAVVALFSSIMGLGMYAEHAVKELKSEGVDHGKKGFLGTLFPFLEKVKK